MDSRHVPPAARSGTVIFLNDDELEALKDLATSFLEHAGVDFWQGIDLDESIVNVRSWYQEEVSQMEHESEYGTELRDQACMLASCQIAMKIIAEFGEGGTSYAVQPGFDMDRSTNPNHVFPIEGYNRSDSRSDRDHMVVDENGEVSYRTVVPDEEIPF